jgi:hypothetical protein
MSRCLPKKTRVSPRHLRDISQAGSMEKIMTMQGTCICLHNDIYVDNLCGSQFTTIIYDFKGGDMLKRRFLILTLLLLPILLVSVDYAVSGINGGTKDNGRNWRITQAKKEYFNGTSYDDMQRNLYYYNQVNPAMLDSIIWLAWSAVEQQWVPFEKASFTYDPTHSLIISSTISNYDYGFWIPIEYHYYTYDSQNRLASSQLHQYDPIWQSWQHTENSYIHYNSNQDFTKYRTQLSSTGEPNYYYIFNYVRDGQGRIVEETNSASPDSLNWFAYERYQRTYHSSDTTTADMLVQRIALYTPYHNCRDFYGRPDILGRLSEEIYQLRSPEDWVNYTRMQYAYSPDQTLFSKTRNGWYDDYWNYSANLLHYYDSQQNLYLQNEYYYDTDGYVLYYRYIYTYDEYTSADDDVLPPVSGLQLHASPNPFADNLSIRIEAGKTSATSVSVYNAKGQLIRKLETSANHAVSWDGRDSNNRAVPDGIYFIRAASDGQTRTAKVLKMN